MYTPLIATAGAAAPEVTFLPASQKKQARWTLARLGHTSTIVGNYLFIVGGHTGTKYVKDVLLLNLGMILWWYYGIIW
jgi:hypothetical protein